MILTVAGEADGPRSVVFAGPEMTIGKQPDCDVVLSDPKVSRLHARLVHEAGRIFLEDLGSTNGTTLGGAAVEGRVEIAPGDEIGIGPFSLRLEPETATAASGDPRYGPLARWLADPAVSEIMVNGPSEIFVERHGRIEPTDSSFPSAGALRELIESIAGDVGRSIDERRPMLDARLRDGSRVNAILPPLAVRGPYLTVRRFSRELRSMEQLVAVGALTENMAGFLRCAVTGRLNVLVSGGTGSGKTTLLNVLCGFLGERERVLTIEDAAELQLPQRHVLTLETRPPDHGGEGEITIRDLLRNALRMRPDRIVVGEVRGGEALEMLQAMNTGHEGSLGTIHANSPREALSRLETLVLFAGTDLPPRAIREQIATAVRLVVHTARAADGRRRVTSITELTGLEGDQFTTGEIFRLDPAVGEDGALQATGYVPRCRDRLLERGQPVDNAWFRANG